MGLRITHYRDNYTRDNEEYFSIGKFISILDFFNYIPQECVTQFEFVSLLLKSPIFSLEESWRNSSSKVLQYLNNSAYLKRIETNGLVIHIGKGIIYDDNKNILLCLSIETQYIFDAIEEGIYEWENFSPDSRSRGTTFYEPFVMFVSTEFANDKKFAVLYRRIKKIYLDFCFEKGIEIRLISSSKIKENTFTNSLNIKFNSLTELNRHLTEDVKHLLLIPLENFKEQNFPLLLDTPPISIKEKKSPWVDLIPEMENRIKVLNQAGDSMLADSDLDEREVEQQTVQLDVSATPSSTTMIGFMEQMHNQPLQWDEQPTSDRIMAMGMSMMSFRNMSADMLGVPSQYFTNLPNDSDSNEEISRDTLEEAINYLNSERDIEAEDRAEEEIGNIEEDSSWSEVIEQQDDNEEEGEDLLF